MTATVNSHLSSIYMFKGRSGIVMDNLMLYVTGGLATARFNTTYSTAATAGFVAQALPGAIGFGLTPFGATANFTETRWGWVAGFGAEYAVTPNITIKSETLYASFPDRDGTTTVTYVGGIGALLAAAGLPGSRGFNFTQSDSIWISKIGLNFRFGGY